MAVETTPLGFQKPDGNEPMRNVDDIISTNAQLSSDILTEVRGQLAVLDPDGETLEITDAAMTAIINSVTTQFSTILRQKVEAQILEKLDAEDLNGKLNGKLDVGELDGMVAADVADPRTLTAQALVAETSMEDALLLRFGLNNLALQNVVMLGSSTTNGTGASKATFNYVNRLSRHLHAAYPTDDAVSQPAVAELGAHLTTGKGIQVVKAAAGNATSANYCDATKQAAVGALNPAAVIHMIGSNDRYYGTVPAAYEANIRGVINGINAAKSATQPSTHVLVHAYERRDTVPTMLYPYAEYRERLRAIATDTPGVRFVDVDPPFRAAGIPASDPYALLPDNVHTNDQGHKIIADRIRDVLRIPVTANVGGEWKDLTLEAGYVHRDTTTFRAQYRVINGMVVLRGGIARTGGAAFASVSQLIARLPEDALAPEFQRTSLGALSTRDAAQAWVVDRDIRTFPNVATATFVMLDTLWWPLRNY